MFSQALRAWLRSVLSLRDPLSDISQQHLARLESLDTPFCNQFDAAWQGLLAMLPEAQKQWAIGLSSRNRDLAAFLSSGFFALAISTGFLVGTGRLFSWAAGMSYIFLCLLAWFLFGYVSLVVRSVLAVLELSSVTPYPSIVR
jgi:hypothetical protein